MHAMAVFEGWEREAPFLVVAAGSVGYIVVDCAGGIDGGLGLKPCNKSCKVLIRDARGADEDAAFPEEAGESPTSSAEGALGIVCEGDGG
jgi:hypothetical protein